MPALSQLNFLHSLGWALVNSLWQMALLWIIYKLILFFSTRLKPVQKTTLATFLIIGGFGWFLFTLISTLFFAAPGDLYNNWIGLFNENSQTIYFGKILSIFTAAYLILLVVPVWNFIFNYHYVQKIRTRGLHKINAAFKIFTRNTAENLGIFRKVQIWISDRVYAPVTIGFLKPVILIPVAAINQLTTQQVEAIILHELYHIRRFDYVINLVINFIKTILYFNPFVKLFVNTIEREREHSCDEMVMQYQYKPAEYATALLLLGKNKQQQMMLAASGKNENLLKRVETILGMNRKTGYSFKQIFIALFTILFIGFANIFFFAKTNPDAFSHLAFNSDINPYYFLNSRTDNDQKQAEKNLATAEITTNSILPNRDEAEIANEFEEADEFETVDPVAAPSFYTVNYTSPVIPKLAKEDELKLKETISATKKILEEKEWKEIEKSYAEVFNSYETENLKNEYKKEVNNINWKKLEDQLKLSYESINWNKVNDEISLSLAQIKLDSIQLQVKIAIDNLVNLENWMKENKTTSIPDTDISLKSIIENQVKAKAQLEKIKAQRIKKVVKI